jgi:hypothetical protein
MDAPNAEPQVYCMSCGRTMTVVQVGRSFAPDYFKQKLKRACVGAGCVRPVPLYRPGVQLGGPAKGQ